MRLTMKKGKFRNVWFQTRNFLEHSFNVKLEIRFPGDTRIMYGNLDQITLTEYDTTNPELKIDNLAIVRCPCNDEDLGEITRCDHAVWLKNKMDYPIIMQLDNLTLNLNSYSVEQVKNVFRLKGVTCRTVE